jgi:predicted nucleic acid-binding protein
VIVVDTNLLVYLYVRGQHTGRAEAVRERDPVWAAPLLWRSEFRNALIGLVRARDLELDDALLMTEDAEQGMSGREFTVVSGDVLELAAQSGCSAYDCEFVSVAQALATTLVTVDRQVLRAFPTIARSPDAFVGPSR